MQTKNTLPITEARKKIFTIVEEVQKSGVYYTLTEHGVPKAVILSARKYELLTEKNIRGKENFLLADKCSNNYSWQNVSIFPKTLVIRDESRVVYLSENDQSGKVQEEGLIKAQLYVQLIEKYKYPLHLVEYGRYVRVGRQDSKRYIEADIIINDQHGNARMIFEVGCFKEFEEHKDHVVADLFELAYSLSHIKKPESLVYFSRAFKAGKEEEKVFVVDYTKFNTFAAWKKAGRPGVEEIGEYK